MLYKSIQYMAKCICMRNVHVPVGNQTSQNLKNRGQDKGLFVGIRKITNSLFQGRAKEGAEDPSRVKVLWN